MEVPLKIVLINIVLKRNLCNIKMIIKVLKLEYNILYHTYLL